MKLPWWMRLGWRTRRIPLVLCAVEFPFTVATLTLFGVADPNTYRTALWKEGAIHGWNSDPIEILYSYANYKPVAAPVPWNQFVTDFNLVIIVLSMFMLLAKTVMYITHVFPPFFSAILHGMLVALYAVSISQQAGPDYLDPLHPSKVPWYLTKGCGDPITPKLQSYCKQAKASFAITVIMCTLFLVYFAVSLASAIPNKIQRAEHTAKEADVESPMSYYDDKKWELEMDRIPKSPGSPAFPMTPRTVAFQTLDGTLGARKPNKDLPLRQHIAM